MKLYIHAGMPKTGSSALQKFLDAHRNRLRHHGVFYPVGAMESDNHSIVVAGIARGKSIPRHVLYYMGNDERLTRAVFQDWMHYLASASKLEHACTILSSEHFFGRTESELVDASERLRRIFDEIVVVVYIRRPSKYYASSTQQILRASHRLKNPAPVIYRAPLERLQRCLADTLDVHVYDEVQSRFGSIEAHFAETYLPPSAAAGPQAARVNTTLSAEAMSILHAYRARIHPDTADVWTHDTAALIHYLVASDRRIDGFVPPELEPGIAQRVDHASVDILWLQDKFGLEFNGIDYREIDPKLAMPRVTSISDLFPVDERRRGRLLRALLKEHGPTGGEGEVIQRLHERIRGSVFLSRAPNADSP